MMNLMISFDDNKHFKNVYLNVVLIQAVSYLLFYFDVLLLIYKGDELGFNYRQFKWKLELE